MRISEMLQLGRLVTPIPDRGLPVYGWFLAKESFSRGLVLMLADTWRLASGDRVLDPFCGSGTTLLACRELGVRSAGFDVHPMMLFASRVKISNYDKEVLEKNAGELAESEYTEVDCDVPGFVKRVFPPGVLNDVLFFRKAVSQIVDEGTRKFMGMALVNSAMKCSWAVKDGCAIRTVKRDVPPLRKVLLEQVRGMIADIGKMKFTDSETLLAKGDARCVPLEDESVSAVITSPPYLNKNEYICAYRVEQWIAGLDEVSGDEALGGLGEDDPGTYFENMRRAIAEIERVCSPKGKICVVVSDACSRDGVIDVGVPLCKIAVEEGLKPKRLIVVNKRHCTTPSRKKLGLMKEGLLIWEK